MIKNIPHEVWAFDCEWVPDLQAGRLLYNLPDDLPTHEVLRNMWSEGGATPENPTPFLRTLFCRVVSIATVIRRVHNNGIVELFLQALPENAADPQQDERYILRRFLDNGLTKYQPQLVGYNSRNADLRILTQRAIIHGLPLRSLCERLDAKPWDSRDLDLMELISGYGKNYAVALHEIATLSGIPGKLDTTGEDVCGLWYRGQAREIIQYNCFDALTTYLVWLRMAFFSDCFTKAEYIVEQQRVVTLLKERLTHPENAFLQKYLDAWRDLQTRTGQISEDIFAS